MEIHEIFNSKEHRPWELPSHKWKYYQEWNDAIFLHWKVDAHELIKFIPKDLEIDTFQESAWVSMVAFDMKNTRPFFLPPFSPISDFHEINIRTYVKFKEKPCVYFLSIEGGRKISCWIAKKMSNLPYQYSKMKRLNGKYAATNVSNNTQFDIEFKIGDELKEKSDLDKFLTERYALVQESQNQLNYFEIHHIEWPIHQLKIQSLEIKYPKFESIIHSTPDLVHYSPGVQVLAWDKVSSPLLK
jgi:uncharacterized protein YqjF (DUF2071 family)